MATTEPTASRPSVIAYVFGGLALAGLLGMSILFFATGLLAPLWAIICLVAVWLMLLVLGCIWIRRHPWRVLLLPFIAAAILYGSLIAGEALLGWRP